VETDFQEFVAARSTALFRGALVLTGNREAAEDGVTIPIDFAGWSLDGAKTYLDKTQTKLGTVTRKAVKGCKPTSVLGVSPHAPQIVHSGDTLGLTICVG
jgi:hypothetical protein